MRGRGVRVRAGGPGVLSDVCGRRAVPALSRGQGSAGGVICGPAGGAVSGESRCARRPRLFLACSSGPLKQLPVKAQTVKLMRGAGLFGGENSGDRR